MAETERQLRPWSEFVVVSLRHCLLQLLYAVVIAANGSVRSCSIGQLRHHHLQRGMFRPSKVPPAQLCTLALEPQQRNLCIAFATCVALQACLRAPVTACENLRSAEWALLKGDLA